MQRKTVLVASGICLMLIFGLFSFINATWPKSRRVIGIEFPSEEPLFLNTNNAVPYSIIVCDDCAESMEKKTTVTFLKLTRREESVPGLIVTKSVLDTLDIQQWEIELENGKNYTGTINFEIPENDRFFMVELFVWNGRHMN